MRLPFLQVPQLDMSRGRTLARILRIPEAHGIGLTVALDAWALEEAPEGDMSGLVRDANPAEAIALAVGWDGAPEALLAALVRVRLVEETPQGVCVASVKRYESAVSAPTRRSDQAARAANERWHGKKDALSMVPAMPNDAKTYMETQTQKEITASASQEPEAVPERQALALHPPAPKAKRQKPEKPADPRHAPLSLALVALGWPHHGGRTAKALAALLGHADREPGVTDAHAEILRRAGIARAWVGFPQAREIHELAEKWGHFAQPQVARGAGPPDVRRGSVRAELIDHTKPEELF